MATAKTGSFYLTETVTLTSGAGSGTRGQSTIDLGAYVNVPTGQAIAVESVDFVYQTADGNGAAGELLAIGGGAIAVQLTDLNPSSTLLIADDQSLIASGCLNIDQTNNILSHNSDLYPDNFGPAALSEAFMVVNDTLYLVAGNNVNAIGTQNVSVTARVRCRVVKLSSKDWMAIAIQSTASDN